MKNTSYTKPEISIIIPMYNIEQYIEQCINSILMQSYKNFELILVDDGSNDNTYSICKKYTSKDNRIFLYSQKNLGVSVARNKGVEISRGEYISFVDGDDILEPFALELLYNAMSYGVYDLSCAQLQIISGNDVIMKPPYFSDVVLYSSHEVAEVCYKDGKQWYMLSGPCVKLYKSSILKEKKIAFPEEMTNFEDLVFNIEYYKHIHSMKLIGNVLYNYRVNPNSASHAFDKRIFGDLLKYFEKRKDFYTLLGEFDKHILACQFLRLLASILRNYYKRNHLFIKNIKITKELLTDKEVLYYINNTRINIFSSKKDLIVILCFKMKSSCIIVLFLYFVNLLMSSQYFREKLLK